MQCPECDEKLALLEVAPCYDCGHSPDELVEFRKGRHAYFRYSFLGVELTLCDFCDADFDSYHPEYLGFPAGRSHGHSLEQLERVEQPKTAQDYCCPRCERRLAFITAVRQIRKRAAKL